MTEVVLKKQLTFTLRPTNETDMKHMLKNIKPGGIYQITVSTDVDGAIPAGPINYTAPPIQPPHQVLIEKHPKEEKYIVKWEERDMPESIKKGDYHFEILVSDGSSTVNETSAKVYKQKQPPFEFTPSNSDSMQSIAVRLVTEEGYQSKLSEVISIVNPNGKFYSFINLSRVLK